MLDDFKKDQPIVYKLLKKATNRTSHAYLFEANGYSKAFDLAISFSKYLLCPNSYSNKENCGYCFLCNRIDNNSFSEIQIVNPDGLWIKKEQLAKLQSEFSRKAVESNKRIYIINHAEKLNPVTANSILKFLEEPEENIIAILITDNKYQLLDTIISRCQIVSFSSRKDNENSNEEEAIIKIASIIFNDQETINNFINTKTNLEKIGQIIRFINFYEKNKLNTILYLTKLWHEYFNDKENIAIAFEVIILYYKDVINFKLNRSLEIFNDYIDEIEKVAVSNELVLLCKKLNKIFELKSNININVNNNLLMDKFIIELEEVR